MIDDALASLARVFSPPFRSVLLKSLGLTLASLAGLGDSGAAPPSGPRPADPAG